MSTHPGTAAVPAAADGPRRAAAPARGAVPRRLYAPLIVGTILNPINSSIVAVALVPIAAAFGVPASQAAWLVTGLYLATSVGQPLAGRLVDAIGAKPVFLVGAGLTMAAGLVGAFAPSFGWLIAARVVLGLGTCAGYPAAMTIVRSSTADPTAPAARGILTVLAVATQTVAVIGPTLGGLLIGGAGWPAVFAVNVPLGLASLVLGALFLPGGRGAASATAHTTARRRVRLDLTGLALFALALVPLLVVIMAPGSGTVWMLVIAVAAGAGFVVRELRTHDPFIDLRMLGRNGALLSTYARATLMALVGYTFLYGYTQWLEHARGLSPAAAGLVLLPTFAVAIVVSALTGRLPRLRPKLAVAALAQVATCLVLLMVGAGTPLWVLLGAAVIMGVSQGLGNVTNQQALIAVAPAAQMGSAAGLMRTFFYLGAILSGAATALLFGAAADTAGLHRVAGVALAASVMFLALTLFDRSLGARREAAR
ncbi:MFS transporter [Microbacterium sp. NPDC091313]